MAELLTDEESMLVDEMREKMKKILAARMKRAG